MGRVTRDSRIKGFLNVAEVFGSLTACGAEAWTSGESVSNPFDSWPFSTAGNLFLPGFNSSPERYMEPNDDKPPSWRYKARKFRQ
jgi:hypothetical protein